MKKDFVSKRVSAFKEYVPGEQAKSIIKLNANENYLSPSPKIKTFLKQYPIERLRLYPDPHALELCATIKKTFGLKQSIGVVVGNGADEIIRGIFTAFFEGNSFVKTNQYNTEAAETVLLSEVTYAGYAPYAHLMGVPITVLPMKDDLSIPLENISNTKAKVVFITNPNNPTGTYIPAKNIISTVKKNSNKLFVIDEAYVDFNSDEKESCIRYLPLDNLLVMKTISKSYSGAGLRLGFAVGSVHLTKSIRKVLDPYNLNMLTLDLAKLILSDRVYFKKAVQQVVSLREWLYTELLKRGFEVFPSEANFLFCKPKLHVSLLPSDTKSKVSLKAKKAKATEIQSVLAANAQELFIFLKSKKIYIRYFSTTKLSCYVRITVGSKVELIALLRGIDAFYKGKIKPLVI